ncbi:response regulator [Catenovulum sediminis]|uniref:histidine kinase n=1 Tax=Catenovulum sediminis TaxID=1740262 RepID=A0ABV1RKP6_9ALTE|nr:response regulator [Catenovulum sediminis]
MESILIVDDEKLNLKTLSALLKRDYVAILAKNGVQALEKAEKYQPDLILLDILMPEMDGFEVLTRLKENTATKEIPVIILTGAQSTEKEEQGLMLGACDYVFKPFNTAILKARIKTHIALQKQKRNLSALTDQLKKANAAKSRFVANMSHEIRTPLTSVLGYAEALKNGEVATNDFEIAVNHIDSNGRHLLSLINDILDFSKIEADQLELMPEKCQLFELLNDLINLASGMPKSADVEFKTDFIFPLPEYIWVDSVRFRQIFVNLLSNAFKFTNTGFVKLSCAFDTEAFQLRITVEDSGIGIAKEEQEKLFAPFLQIHSGDKFDNLNGTGLGLNISQYLIEKMGGEIQLSSQLEYGTLFSVVLNLTELENNALIYSVPSAKHTIKQKLSCQKLSGRVLVAEDNLAIRQLIQMVLSHVGIDVVAVENGELAIEELIASHFDLIFLDVQMPVMDGLETLAMIRQLGYQEMPILALSAHVIKDEIESFLKAGFDDFVAKPVERHVLLDALLKYLGGTNDRQMADLSLELDKSVESELKNTFLTELNDMQLELSEAKKKQSIRQLVRVAHKLKGAASTFAYADIGAAAADLEVAVRTGRNWLDIQAKLDKLLDLTEKTKVMSN